MRRSISVERDTSRALRFILTAFILVITAAPTFAEADRDTETDRETTSGNPDTQAILLRHNVSEGTYRLVSTNRQTISLDGRIAREAEIITRVRMNHLGESVETESGTPGGVINAEFFLTEGDRLPGQAVGLRGRYESRFVRTPRGEMEIDDRYIMPVARDFPRFPEEPVSPGDRWYAEAWELHDLSEGYALSRPLRFSALVAYRYLGVREWEGRRYPAIAVEYQIAHREERTARLYPQTVTGASEQTLYWNHDAGRLAGSVEEYWIEFHLSDGHTILYEGNATTRTVVAHPLQRTTTTQELQDAVTDAEIADVTVEEGDDGISLILDEIGFPPDSARLTAAERERLDRIAEILRRWPDNDVLITGHTALAGTREGRRDLSLRRARVVGAYLLNRGIREPSQILFRGVGAEEPRGDNATEIGRRQNRRVEITILDN
ncbi:MAG: OmpA family protein [Spirochaeta sp.]|jgi:outer membrane protein OmpA-like peptidoglycan-associated protein|nr:OmpA family protein [Spirochaeta sp.]